MTKELYPEVGKLHNTTGTRVDRGIRHALTLGTVDDSKWYRVIGKIGPMANGEFLATLGESIKIKLAVEG